jgi:nucleotide-binding universal stress UspA family protein
MAFKDILVRLGNDETASARADYALALAETHDAHVAGVATATWWIYGAVAMGPVPREVVVSIQDAAQQEAEAAEKIFTDHAAKTSVSHETRVISGTVGEILGGLVRHARHTDLTILPQPKEDQGRAAAESLMFESGGPVMFVPYVGVPAKHPAHVLVGWDGGQQAARAIHDAMPLLEKAERITLLTIDPQKRPENHGEEPGADIGAHLARHGLKVEVDSVVAPDIDAGNTILSYAADLSADALVMGGYGHSRVRELVLGGVTRTILSSMTIPVLMSH